MKTELHSFSEIKILNYELLFSNRVGWNFRFQTKPLCIIHPISVELAEYARTQYISVFLALDCENSEESPCEQGEYVNDVEYETPDLFAGVKGVDYGIVYKLGDEEVEMEAEA